MHSTHVAAKQLPSKTIINDSPIFLPQCGLSSMGHRKHLGFVFLHPLTFPLKLPHPLFIFCSYPPMLPRQQCPVLLLSGRSQHIMFAGLHGHQASAACQADQL